MQIQIVSDFLVNDTNRVKPKTSLHFFSKMNGQEDDLATLIQMCILLFEIIVIYIKNSIFREYLFQTIPFVLFIILSFIIVLYIEIFIKNEKHVLIINTKNTINYIIKYIINIIEDKNVMFIAYELNIKYNNNICGICLDNKNNNSSQYIIKCGHSFHKKCLNNLLNKKCPFCSTSFDYNNNNTLWNYDYCKQNYKYKKILSHIDYISNNYNQLLF